MLSNYKKIKEVNKKANEKDHIYSKIFSHPLSFLLVAIVEKTFITPNILTLISTVLALIGSAVILLVDTHLGLIFAWLILHFALIFDSADGQLARYKKNGSRFGAYLDVFTDYFYYITLVIVITIRFSYENENAFLIGIIVMGVYSLALLQNHLIIKALNAEKQLSQKKEQASGKLFGKSKLKNIVIQIQEGLTGGGSYMYIGIAFILNKPEYYLYIIGLLSTLLILKRSVIFYFTVK